MFGILNINKPAGWTSRDVVNRVQRLVRPAKVGHAGTLDPLATGVLVVCVGPATRLIEYVQRMPKRYCGVFQLGVTSPSDDIELELTPFENAPVPSPASVAQALPEFLGEIMQRPPAYSAIKLKGRKAYDLARAGEKVELEPRPVTIHAMHVVEYSYPTLVLDIVCGSGTYVRSLGRDLAESLGTAAVMSGLERTGIGDFGLEDAISPEDLPLEVVEENLRPPVEAVRGLAQVTLTAAEQGEIRHGRYIDLTLGDAAEIAAVDEAGNLVALLRPRDSGKWGPKIVLKYGE